MIRYEKEVKCGYHALLSRMHKIPCETEPYKIVYENGDVVYAKFLTMWESDNDLDLDDPDYEEYNSIAWINLSNNVGFEMCYHNMPKEVYYKDKLIFKDGVAYYER